MEARGPVWAARLKAPHATLSLAYGPSLYILLFWAKNPVIETGVKSTLFINS